MPEPPRVDLEIEAAFLGSILRRPGIFAGIKGELSSEHFADPSHGQIWAAFLRLDADQVVIEGPAVAALLDFDSASPHAFVAHLAAGAGVAANVGFYIEHILKQTRKRGLIEIGEDLSNGAIAGTSDLNALVTTLTDRLSDLRGADRVPEMPPIDTRSWLVEDPPPRHWLVERWLPEEEATGLYGDGGAGKTLLAQMLLTALAVGARWLNIPSKKINTLGYFCEDDPDELWRRQVAINKLYNVEMAEVLEHFTLVSGKGQDNILMDFTSTPHGVMTPVLTGLIDLSRTKRVGLVGLDTLADIFAGNWVAPDEPKRFVQIGLGRIIKECRAAVLVLAHPSVAGMAGGEGTFGSVGWNAAFRTRMYLERDKGEQGEGGLEGRMILTRKKANYSSRDERIELEWKDWVFETEHEHTGVVASIERGTIERDFLEALDKATKAGVVVNVAPTGKYAPKLLRQFLDGKQWARADMEGAMFALLKTGEIEQREFGKPSRRENRLVRVFNLE